MSTDTLSKRILDISYQKKLSHIGSCFSAVPIIDEIFSKKKPNEKFVLSSGHAGLALYCVLEKYGGRNAEEIFEHHGVHPDRCAACGIDASTGSLGLGLPLAVGMALSDRSRMVYCLCSDGEMREGSIWEAFQICKEQKIQNLEIHVNINGFGAYHEVDRMDLANRLMQFSYFFETENGWVRNIHPHFTENAYFGVIEGQSGHYQTLSKEDYDKALRAS